MFAEYLNAGGNWLESEIYIKAVQQQMTKKRAEKSFSLTYQHRHVFCKFHA